MAVHLDDLLRLHLVTMRLCPYTRVGANELCEGFMRGGLVVIVVAALALLLLCPSLASANKAWPIYDTTGSRAGSGRVENHPEWGGGLYASVWKNTPTVRYCGLLMPVEGVGSWVPGAWTLLRGDGSGGIGGLVMKVNGNRCNVYLKYAVPKNNRIVGRVSRGTSGPWHLARLVKGHYRKAGTAPRGCPGAVAAGGARLLGLFGKQGLH